MPDLRDPDDYMVRILVMDGAIQTLVDIVNSETGDEEDAYLARAAWLVGRIDGV